MKPKVTVNLKPHEGANIFSAEFKATLESIEVKFPMDEIRKKEWAEGLSDEEILKLLRQNPELPFA